jgi:hypothetical protein
MTRALAAAGLAALLLLATASSGDTGAPPPFDGNPLLDHPDDARDTAAVAYERITGEAATAEGDPDLNRALRDVTLPADPAALVAPD